MPRRPEPVQTTISTIQMTGSTLFGTNGEQNPSEWLPFYQSCIEHFLNVAQYRYATQSLAAHINILLPCQRVEHPHSSSATRQRQFQQRDGLAFTNGAGFDSSSLLLVPYIRRLVVTATDTPTVMQELFGDNWRQGVGPILSRERVNYLFAAKSGGWLNTKAQYDILPYESVPFLRPLRNPQEDELRAAEARWSEWLAMEDWMVGPRSPFEED